MLEHLPKIFSQIKSLGDIFGNPQHFFVNSLSLRKLLYGGLSLLSLIIVGLLVLTNLKTPEKFVVASNITVGHSPVIASASIQKTSEVFSFAPGLSLNKLEKLDLRNLQILSYFDIPITDEGEINKDSKTYKNFKSKAVQLILKDVKLHGTRVLITLTQTKGDSIKKLLDNPEAQDKLISQIVEEVEENYLNGVTVDFETRETLAPHYKRSYSRFIENLATKLHSIDSKHLVTVVVPTDPGNQKLYNLRELAQVSDRILVMASNFAVPEYQDGSPINPVFGYGENDHWSMVRTSLNRLLKEVPQEKLVLERAWYGNGNNYPLYTPEMELALEDETLAVNVSEDEGMVDKLLGGVPSKAREAAKRNIPRIMNALQSEGILDSNVLAYALATIEHETAGTFEPIDEYGGALSARRRGYEGGVNYFGRGFIQLTHLRNYKAMGIRIGMGDALAKNPELASSPDVAAKILAAFFKDNNIASLASRGKFVAARNPVNPDNNGRKVANLAAKYDFEKEKVTKVAVKLSTRKGV
ncbi:MAG: glycosyl hydrolase family 18 protein [Candidatus Daviesbacteria bacterium]|nr:glycosyl hydrolase family 18 protein [Candidatus Daviesbacteria bacterium]